jgi:hypothetical protein
MTDDARRIPMVTASLREEFMFGTAHAHIESPIVRTA